MLVSNTGGISMFVQRDWVLFDNTDADLKGHPFLGRRGYSATFVASYDALFKI